MCTGSGFFTAAVSGKLRPPMQVIQWNIDGIDPSGVRHIESGNWRPSAKIGFVGGFDAQSETENKLDFGEVVVDDSGFKIRNVCITANLGEVNSHPNSFFNNIVDNTDTNFKLFNIRLWMPNKSIFASSGVSTDFYFKTSQTWVQGANFSIGDPGVSLVPSSLPSTFNVPVGTGVQFASGAFRDLQFSHYMYVFGQVASGSIPLGTYGEDTGRFIFRITYDWSDINANILDNDAKACE